MNVHYIYYISINCQTKFFNCQFLEFQKCGKLPSGQLPNKTQAPWAVHLVHADTSVRYKQLWFYPGVLVSPNVVLLSNQSFVRLFLYSLLNEIYRDAFHFQVLEHFITRKATRSIPLMYSITRNHSSQCLIIMLKSM